MTEPNPAPADKQLADLVEVIWEQLAQGSAVDVESLLAVHAEHADQLRALLPTMQLLAEMGSNPKGPSASRIQVLADDHPTGGEPVLGDFRILREVGRGGMGVVYEAEQVSLRRRVALKVLPTAAMLDPRSLQRFRNEAQAAACLHHSQIVPIYAVGCERGVHYYAMQFIDGLTLAEVITNLRTAAGLNAPAKPESLEKELDPTEDSPNAAHSIRTPSMAPSQTETEVMAALSTEKANRSLAWFRRIAEQFAEVAAALHHAHELGVIHRDIKPGNLMLDRLGRIWITDFGLARIEGEGNLTLTGDLVGTLRYMSPEQALAKRIGVDHRTDIYSLGVTLYELLTLHPAIPGPGRQEILRQIAFEDPKLLRKFNREIPKDLETIVIKMLAKEPRQRYSSGQELVEDFRRFLRDEPIKAQRPNISERLRKWTRRHPTFTSVAATLTLVLVFMVVVGSLQIAWRMQHAFQKSIQVNGQIQSELAQATKRLQQSRLSPRDRAHLAEAKVLVRHAESLADSEWADASLEDQIQALRIQLKQEEELLNLIQKLDDAQLAGATFNRDDVGFRVDQWLEAIQKAFAQWGIDPATTSANEAAQKIASCSEASQLQLIGGLDSWKYLRREYGDKPGRESCETWLFDVLNQVDADPWRRRLRHAMHTRQKDPVLILAEELKATSQPAHSHFILGRLLSDNPTYRSLGMDILRRAHELYPDNFWIHIELYNAYGRLSPPEPQNALRHATAAAAIRPESSGARLIFGIALMRSGDLPAAETVIRRVIHDTPNFAAAHGKLGEILDKRRDFAGAEASYVRSAQLAPENATSYRSLGAFYFEQQNFDGAISAYRKGVELEPNNAVAHSNLGAALYSKGQVSDALVSHRMAVTLAPWSEYAHFNLGSTLLDVDIDEAISEYRRAIQLCDEYRNQDNRAHLSYYRWMNESIELKANASLGAALFQKKEYQGAIDAFRRCIALAPSTVRYHTNLGAALQAVGQHDQAIRAFRDAIKLDIDYPMAYSGLAKSLRALKDTKELLIVCRRLVELRPENVEDRFALANALLENHEFDEASKAYRWILERNPNHFGALNNLGRTLQEIRDYAGSIQVIQKAIEIKPDVAGLHMNLAQSLLLSGDFTACFKSYDKAVELAPENPVILDVVAWKFSISTNPERRKLNEAAKLAKRAVQLSPQTGEYWRTLGLTMYRSDEFEQAISALEKSLALRTDENSPLDWILLSLAHWKTGDKMAARQRYEQALEGLKSLPTEPDSFASLRAESAKLMGLTEDDRPTGTSR